MRKDIATLLARLGEQSFNYQDFEGPSDDGTIWPVLEALLLDPRVVGQAAAAVGPVGFETRMARPAARRTAGEAAPVAGAAPRGVMTEIFGGYGKAAASGDDGASVRNLLDRLATRAA